MVTLLVPVGTAAADGVGPASVVRDIADGGQPLRSGACDWPACVPVGYGGSLPAQLTSRGGRLFFAADDRLHGYELWVSEGTAESTRRLTDLCSGRCGSDPMVVGWLGDELFFWARHLRHGRELWATDGTAAGTRLVRDVCPGPCDGDRAVPFFGARPFEASWWSPGPRGRRFRGDLLFPVRQDRRLELWATGGHRWTTRALRFGCRSGDDREDCGVVAFAVAGEAVYAADVHGGMWRSEDLARQPRQVVDPCPPVEPTGGPGAGQAVGPNLPTAVLGDRDGAFLVRQCRSAGPVEVFHVRPGESEGRWVLGFTAPTGAEVVRELVDGRLAIVERSGGTSSRLWGSDGTAAGSGVLRELAGGLTPRGVHAGRLYLSQAPPASPEVLWVSDGRGEGTAVLLDVAVRSPVAGVGPYAAFFARGEADGGPFHELWISDGTPDGTGAVQRFPFRLEEDEAPSTPLLHAAADRLFLSVDAGDLGQELWSLPRAAANPYGCDPDGHRLCLGGGRFAVTVDVEDRAGDRRPAPTVAARGLPVDGRAGFFALGRGLRPELLVKVLDGGAVNGHHWVFHGGLLDRVYDTVGYAVEVRDLRLGESRLYRRRPGDLCGGADTTAFSSAPTEHLVALRRSWPLPSAASTPVCGADTLCLHGGRFGVRVDRADGTAATPVAWDDESGWFHFFSSDNPELLVRVVDGREIDGSFWVLWGGATTVPYRLTVTDGLSGAAWTSDRPAGGLCGGADTTAF